MRYAPLIACLATFAAAAPSLAQDEPAPTSAPAAAPGALYCLRVEPVTGSRIEAVRCETRVEWSLLGVDLDHEWPREGVRVIG